LKKQVASSEVILLQVDALEKALNILTKLNWPVAAEEQKLRVQIRHPDDVTRLIDLLRGHQIRIYRIESEENRLEHFFLSLG
jgi:hypothetical protein